MLSAPQSAALSNLMTDQEKSEDFIEALISQADVKDELNDIYQRMGLGQEISAALQKPCKRGFGEVSDAETPVLRKKPKSKKLTDVDSSRTTLKLRQTCISAGKNDTLANSRNSYHRHHVHTDARCVECVSLLGFVRRFRMVKCRVALCVVLRLAMRMWKASPRKSTIRIFLAGKHQAILI